MADCFKPLTPPVKKREKLDQVLKVRLDETTLNQIRSCSRLQGLSPSEFVRIAVLLLVHTLMISLAEETPPLSEGDGK